MVGAVRHRDSLLLLLGHLQAHCSPPSTPLGSPPSSPPSSLQCPSDIASGASAVAIDNKIEQAMDLVKSHLMFAVREEVEVLKDKIAELLERIAQLEQENSILKAHATQETLAQLTTSPLPSSSQSQETGTAV